MEPVDPSAGSPQAKNLPGREPNPTHQQIIGLKLYWARPCPPEQDSVFATTSPSPKKAESESASRSVMSDSLWPHRLYCPWNSPGHSTGVGRLSLLQGLFPTQRLNPGLPHCWQILYQLSHKGIPRILKWVPYPLSSGSSWPRNQTGLSCIAGRFFTNWAIREAPKSWVLKNWFWIAVLEKTLESPLDCKKIQPVHPKGNLSWIFIGRTDAEAKIPIL